MVAFLDLAVSDRRVDYAVAYAGLSGRFNTSLLQPTLFGDDCKEPVCGYWDSLNDAVADDD